MLSAPCQGLTDSIITLSWAESPSMRNPPAYSGVYISVVRTSDTAEALRLPHEAMVNRRKREALSIVNLI